jgi:NADH-quinone oxidoreductase subunit L
MFLAAGVAAYTAAIFHLVTHAFFKALLFLGAGAVILGTHHEQDIDRMGGLARRMPWTHATFLVGVLAIAGMPGFSGFFSKDEILLAAYLAHDVPGHEALYILALGTAGLTALYMFRLHFRAFAGETRAPPNLRAHVHEQGSWILVPLFCLAFLSVVGGLLFGLPDLYGEALGVERSNSLKHFLGPVLGGAEHEVSAALEVALAGIAVGAAAVGAGLAAILYLYAPGLPRRLGALASGLYRLLWNRYYVDEIYDALVVRPIVRASDRILFRFVDVRVIDGAGVNGTARAVRALADRGLKYAQTGFAQSYLLVMLVGGVVLIAYFLGGF